MLETGFNYLLYEEKADISYRILEDFVSKGAPALCLTTAYPSKLKKMYKKLADATVIWLSESSGGGVETMSASRLDFEVTRTMTRFMRDNKGGIVLLDGFEYLILENDFEKVRKFIKKINDFASMNEATFIVTVNKESFPKEVITTLSKDFDIVGNAADYYGEKIEDKTVAAQSAPAPTPPPPQTHSSFTPSPSPAAAPPRAAHHDEDLIGEIMKEDARTTTTEMEIEDIYLIHRSTGTLIQRRTWRENDLIDPDLVGSMFRAILDFINQSFASGEVASFSRIDVKGYIILIYDSKYLSLAMVFSGNAELPLYRAMDDIKAIIKENIAEVEENYENALEDYDGDVDSLRGTRKYMDYLSTGVNRALEKGMKADKRANAQPAVSTEAASVPARRPRPPSGHAPVNVEQNVPEEAAEAFNQGVQLGRLRRYDEAIEFYDKAIAIRSDYIKAIFNKAVALQMLNRLEEAILAYDQVLAVNPGDPEAWSNKGIALRGMGRTQEAIECYDQALSLNPGDAGLWSNRGIALRSLGMVEEAIESYDQALKINPNDAGIWSNKGVALGSIGELEEALDCYERALAIDPNRRVARRNRDILLKKLGRA